MSLPSETLSPRRLLPEGWSDVETVEDTVEIERLTVRRAGVASVAPDGEEVTGSAAALEATGGGLFAVRPIAPSTRALFELLERASVVAALADGRERHELLSRDRERLGSCDAEEVFPVSDDPATWRYARSNGVALYGDWRGACERALWELAERDRILASWYGHVRPERIDGPPLDASAAPSWEWSAWSFPEEGAGSFSSGIDVVGVFGFPRRKDVPLALGFAARPGRRAALADATREAIQAMAFLWGEPEPDAALAVAPTAMGHLDHYQRAENHHVLRGWLAGEHAAIPPAGARGQADEVVRWVDLTPPSLSGRFYVAKAICAAARPLAFGASPFVGHLPGFRQVHPIA